MKVNREYIKATLVTLCVVGVIVNFIHKYREMRDHPDLRKRPYTA
jgi:putative effector of murein hydrolase LrgA (UPF0299 family)